METSEIEVHSMSQEYVWALTVSDDIEKCFSKGCKRCSSFHYLHQWEQESYSAFCKRVDYILENKVHSTSKIIKKYKNSGLTGMLDKFPKGDKFYKVDSNAFESLSEKLASILLKCSDLDPDSYISYELAPLIIDDKFKIGCESLNFKKEYLYEQILFYLQSQESNRSKSTKKAIFKVLHQMGEIEQKFQLLLELITLKTAVPESIIEKRLLSMMAFDLLILNRDRHFGNLIFLDDLKEKVNPIPLFDYGNSVIGGINSDEVVNNFFAKTKSMGDIWNIVVNQNDRMFNEPFYRLGEFTFSNDFFLYFDYEKILHELEEFEKEQLLYKSCEVELSIELLLYCLERTEDFLWKRI